MDAIISVGAALSLTGIAGLAVCIRIGLKARSPDMDEEKRRAALRRAVIWNTAALFVSAVGLMFIVFGILLA